MWADAGYQPERSVVGAHLFFFVAAISLVERFSIIDASKRAAQPDAAKRNVRTTPFVGIEPFCHAPSFSHSTMAIAPVETAAIIATTRNWLIIIATPRCSSRLCLIFLDRVK
jgi:hypothetical protein